MIIEMIQSSRSWADLVDRYHKFNLEIAAEGGDLDTYMEYDAFDRVAIEIKAMLVDIWNCELDIALACNAEIRRLAGPDAIRDFTELAIAHRNLKPVDAGAQDLYSELYGMISDAMHSA